MIQRLFFPTLPCRITKFPFLVFCPCLRSGRKNLMYFAYAIKLYALVIATAVIFIFPFDPQDIKIWLLSIRTPPLGGLQKFKEKLLAVEFLQGFAGEAKTGYASVTYIPTSTSIVCLLKVVVIIVGTLTIHRRNRKVFCIADSRVTRWSIDDLSPSEISRLQWYSNHRLGPRWWKPFRMKYYQ